MKPSKRGIVVGALVVGAWVVLSGIAVSKLMETPPATDRAKAIDAIAEALADLEKIDEGARD